MPTLVDNSDQLCYHSQAAADVLYEVMTLMVKSGPMSISGQREAKADL